MKENKRMKKYLLWMTRTLRIISFKEVKGFEVLRFNNQEEKMAYVIEKGFNGYRIQ